MVPRVVACMRRHLRIWSLVFLVVGKPVVALAQDGILRVQVRSEGTAVAGATVAISGVERMTDSRGETVFPVAAGSTTLRVVMDGFITVSTGVVVAAGAEQAVVVDLVAQPKLDEEVTVVGATRNERRVEDIAMRVEVLPREEIEEKMMMTPGDIVMMLNEMGGMRVQATSPALGAASVRIQGMRGRYTRVLSDGLPLFGDVAGLGLLQIPPMDLGQVEVIKGVASALYGAGAMGGVINLASRRPSREPQRELLINRSALGATDATVFLAGPLKGRWSGTLLAGGHWQSKNDVDNDGWADLAGYERAVVRPRVFWDNGAGSTFFATAGYTGESRTGGTVTALPATGLPYLESLDTRRYDAGAVAQFLVADRYVVTARGAFNRQRHEHTFGEQPERDRHATSFAELAARGSTGKHGWIGGVAFQRDTYRGRDVPGVDYAYNVPGMFGQYDVDVTPALTLSGSARLDVHGEYGAFFSPRLSLLARRGEWTSRFSVGSGFFAPTPITEDTEAAGLTTLVIARPLKAERGTSASFDLTRRQGALSYTATLFASRIVDPVRVDRAPVYTLRNLMEPTLNLGAEVLTTVRQGPYALTGTYTYVHATEVRERCLQRRGAHAAAQRRYRRHVGAGGRRPCRPRVLRDWIAAARREPVSREVSAIRRSSARSPNGRSDRFGCSSTARTWGACGRPTTIRWSALHAGLMGAGPWTPGPRSKDATSTAACV